jgi:hypothetical protein
MIIPPPKESQKRLLQNLQLQQERARTMVVLLPGPESWRTSESCKKTAKRGFVDVVGY